mmetsp:Transcript_12860/g.24555  ORF Transcript_12860/g.24555 Transcript_12860/m.24555 type:complete len:216 (+) Transcript_12860:362-1009(+)
MFLDLSNAFFPTQPLFWLDCPQLLKQVFRVALNEVRQFDVAPAVFELWVFLRAGAVSSRGTKWRPFFESVRPFAWTLTSERIDWSLRRNHVVDEDTHAPVIRHLVISYTCHHLWGPVSASAPNMLDCAFPWEFEGHSHVCNLTVPVCSQQDVGRFDVSVDVAEAVDVVEPEKNFRGVESSLFEGKGFFSQVREEVPACADVKEEMHGLFAVEGIP